MLDIVDIPRLHECSGSFNELSRSRLVKLNVKSNIVFLEVSSQVVESFIFPIHEGNSTVINISIEIALIQLFSSSSTGTTI